MSLVMSSPSHGSAVSLSTAGSDSSAHHHQLVSGGSPSSSSSSSVSSAKKRKRDGGDSSLIPLPLQQLFPELNADKLQAAAAFDPTMAMLAATGMLDAQALRAVDWLSEVTSGGKQLQALAPGSEDMVKTASDILRSLVEHKLPLSSGSSDHPATPVTGTKGTYPQFDSFPASLETGERRQAATPSRTPAGEEKAAECSECGKVFKGKADLLRHIDAEHSAGAARIFRCDECPYETRHQSNLSVHRRTHTGERPYYCGACGQSYTQGHQLKTHIRSRHGGNMAFYNMDKHGMGRGPGRATYDLKMNLSGLQSSASSVIPSSSSANSSSTAKNDKISQLLAAASGTTGRGVSTASSQLPASFQGLVNASTSAADMTSPFLGMLPSHLRPFLDPASAASLALMGSGGGSAGNAAAAAAAANLFSQFFPFNAPAGLMPLTATGELPSAATQKTLLDPLSSLFSTASSAATGSPSLSASLFADALLGNTVGKAQPATDSLDAILGKLPVTSSASQQQVDLSAGGAYSLLRQQLGVSDDAMMAASGSASEVQQQSLLPGHLQDCHRSSPSTTRPEDLSLLPAEPQQTASQHQDTNDDCTDGEAMENGSVTSGQLAEDEAGSVDACHCMESASGDQQRHQAACQHRQQLLRLRQSVMRMLNVLAPNLGLDRAADLNTTQIDDLLHEVLFGNLDDGVSK